MDRRGRFSDNIFVERLWRSLKYEDIYVAAYQNVAEARHGIAAYFNFCNHERLHQALGYRAPCQVFAEAMQFAKLRRRRNAAGADRELTAQSMEHRTWAGFCTLRSADRGRNNWVHRIHNLWVASAVLHQRQPEWENTSLPLRGTFFGGSK